MIASAVASQKDKYLRVVLEYYTSKTTQIYTQVTRMSLQNLKSPLDGLDI